MQGAVIHAHHDMLRNFGLDLYIENPPRLFLVAGFTLALLEVFAGGAFLRVMEDCPVRVPLHDEIRSFMAFLSAGFPARLLPETFWLRLVISVA